MASTGSSPAASPLPSSPIASSDSSSSNSPPSQASDPGPPALDPVRAEEYGYSQWFSTIVYNAHETREEEQGFKGSLSGFLLRHLFFEYKDQAKKKLEKLNTFSMVHIIIERYILLIQSGRYTSLHIYPMGG